MEMIRKLLIYSDGDQAIVQTMHGMWLNTMRRLEDGTFPTVTEEYILDVTDERFAELEMQALTNTIDIDTLKGEIMKTNNEPEESI